VKTKDIETLLGSLEDFQSAARPTNEFDDRVMAAVANLYTDLLVALDTRN
jgi:hypothetical protein